MMKVYVYVLCVYLLITEPVINAYNTIYARYRARRAKAILRKYFK